MQELVAQGVSTDSDEWNNLRVEFEEFRPAELIGTGPFRLNRNLITEAQYTLEKWNDSWLADQIAFDRIIVYNGETPTITPLVLAREVDYADPRVSARDRAPVWQERHPGDPSADLQRTRHLLQLRDS